MNRHSVSFLLIGGLNYFLVHKPVTTQDIDLFIDDSHTNRTACEAALAELDGEWGRRDEDWGPVAEKMPGWLRGQSVFCLLTSTGPVDIFLSVPGLSDFESCAERAINFSLDSDMSIRLLSSRDMLECQLNIPETDRKTERIKHLREVILRDS
jgi:hypothetical protein